MKKILFYALFLFGSLFFTSCLEITEEVAMNKDGSGSATFTLNLSESKDNIKHYMAQETYQGVKIPQIGDIEQSLAEMKTIMQNVQGLSNVQTHTDFDHFVFKVSGDFANVDVLNDATNTLIREVAQKNPMARPIYKDNFKVSNGRFQRLFDYPIDTQLYTKLGMMEQFLLESARFVGIYRFSQPIKEVTNTKVTLSPSKKAAMLRTTLAEIAKGEATLANEIIHESK